MFVPSGKLTMIGPAMPTAPLWMCASCSADVKLVMSILKLTELIDCLVIQPFVYACGTGSHIQAYQRLAWQLGIESVMQHLH